MGGTIDGPGDTAVDGAMASAIDGAIDGTTDSSQPHPITEFPVFDIPTHIDSIAVAPDGNVWFSNSGTSVWRITVTGEITKFSELGTATDPVAVSEIIVGPDGNLWFADSTYRHVGRLTTAGALTSFPLPADFADAENIAVGPDGNLWFCGRGEPRIGRVTPAGAITSFPSNPEQTPYDITSGPDGNIWFTQGGAGIAGVAHIAADGSGLVEIPFPSSDYGHIARGADGNLWVTEVVTAKIARVSPAGVITEFTIPTPGSRPTQITLGPDGNMWFAEGRGSNIARITPAGDITEFPVPEVGVSSIAIAPNRAIWIGFVYATSIATMAM